MALPLDGVRILALEQFGAGPYGSSHLADLGAEVIKIEDPAVGGDVGRHVPPYLDGENCLYFEAFNRGKKSISLDLATPAGREIFDALVAKSDAVYSNLRGDVPSKIGIMYDDLKHLNPAIVCCSLSGFGMTGPRRSEPGYDYILQGLAGWMDITGEPDGPPTKSGLSIVDFAAGLVAGMALLAGLNGARRDGQGMDCDVSLFDTAVNLLTYPGVWHLNAGFEPQRLSHSRHPSLVPFQAFEVADGWLVVACAKEKFWTRLAAVMNLSELLDDDRFKTFADRQHNYDAFVAILQQRFMTRTQAEWMPRLREAAVPAGEVKTVAQALQDPHVAARNLVVEAEHPHYGTVRTLASPVRVGELTAKVRRAPRLGEQTEELLRGVLGYTSADIAEASRNDAFGRPR